MPDNALPLEYAGKGARLPSDPGMLAVRPLLLSSATRVGRVLIPTHVVHFGAPSVGRAHDTGVQESGRQGGVLVDLM